MRFRGKSIRRKIVALLLVPLVSLTAIWAFATVLTGREAGRLFTVSSLIEEVGYPTEDTVRVLQQERRQTLAHLADPRASDGLAALKRSRAATDRAVAAIRRHAADPDVRDALGSGSAERLTAVLDAFDGIDSLRRSVEDGTINRSQAYEQYNLLVDPCYILLANLHAIDDVELDKQYRALVNLARARELLSREDALLGSALIVGTLSRAEVREVSDLAAQRTLLYDTNLPLLPSTDRERYERFWENAESAPLRVAEESAIAAGPGEPSGVTAKSWDTAAGNVLKGLSTLDDEAGDRYQDRVSPIATSVIVQAVIAGALGLVALLAAVLVSVRIGRGLIRDLRQLRLEAHEASGVRLPSVMRRLSAGEQVDVETEVPRLEYDRNEIGEVGQALNTLQRAAVEAAVKQAELRSGVSEVFVNLARRNQVLLHKQLTLLDTMERRTEDPEELADLFRLDHLTTRMRRHAEGLVILSGAAPSRQWRKPIQLMDVVRAAVAEVEDYERVEVRRLPRTAVTGPAVADLTHLVAELLENATVFSPPHTAVQVLGERVANGFTLEIHDRGLGMTADALLDANLRLAETPEFELSDTDRLGLFVVSRLAQRQNVRVSLQPSPYGGTTAVVFIPDALLTDDVPDTNGIGFRLDRPRPSREAELEESHRASLSQVPVRLPGLPPSLLDGPIELEAPVDLDALGDFPDTLDGAETERGGLFRPRRSTAHPDTVPTGRRGEHLPSHGTGGPDPDTVDPADLDDDHLTAPVPLPRRRTPKLVSSHGRPVSEARGRRADDTPEPPVTRGPGRGSRTEGEPEAPVARGFGRGGRAEDDPGAPVGRAFGHGAEDDPEVPGTRRPGRDLGKDGAPGTPQLRGPGRPEPDGPAPLPTRRRGASPMGRRTDPADRPADRPTGHPDLRPRPAEPTTAGPAPSEPTLAEGPEGPGDGTGPLPRRVRQANLAPQLKQDRPRTENRAAPEDRDAEEVRNRMASLQRGWQRGRRENAAQDDTQSGTAPQRTTKGDGR
ncbi:sensor histidine kinase [Streptomyces flavalbus]|uniref:histidine kinase n=1 Tax=Streptomyces flavalbus TaxID=2665155 RepID=A0ABW2W2A7_9ACTN